MAQIQLDDNLITGSKKTNGNGTNGAIPVAPDKNGNGNGKGNEAFTKMYIDVHEPKEIREMLRSEKGIYVEVKSLPWGDYAWGSSKMIYTWKEEVYEELQALLNKKLCSPFCKEKENCLLRERMKVKKTSERGKENIIGTKGKIQNGKEERPSSKGSGERIILDTRVGREEGDTGQEKRIVSELKNYAKEKENMFTKDLRKDSESSMKAGVRSAKNVEIMTQEFSKFTTWMKSNHKIEEKLGEIFSLKGTGTDCNSCVQIATELNTFVEKDEGFPLREQIPGSIGIERKTLNDFYNSIVHGDKHIWKQIFGLKRCFERPMLIIERWDESFLSSRQMEKTIYGAIASIFLMGVSVIGLPGRGQNIRPFVEQVAYLFYSSDKKALSMRPMPEKRRIGRKKDYISDALCMIPTVGRRKADAIANRVNSMEEVCKLSDAELKALCPGMGPDGIGAVRWVLNGKEWKKKEQQDKHESETKEQRKEQEKDKEL